MLNPAFNRLVFVLSLVGLLVAAYLWKMHATPQYIPCGISRGCETVANSPYSQFPPGVGPPIAAYGVFGYIALAGLAFLRTLPSLRPRDGVLLGLSVAGAAFGLGASLWLTYLELYVIKAICKWCMASQGIIAAIFLLTIVEVGARRRRRAVPQQA